MVTEIRCSKVKLTVTYLDFFRRKCIEECLELFGGSLGVVLAPVLSTEVPAKK